LYHFKHNKFKIKENKLILFHYEQVIFLVVPSTSNLM